MFYQIKSYFSFLLRSTNQHGVHSPFVFDLITNCFYDKKKYPEYDILNEYRKNLINSSEDLHIEDFGAGSRVFKTNRRRIKDIAKNAGIHPKQQRLLFRIARYFKPKTTFEFGTSLGMSTAAMALGNLKNSIVTVEGCAQTASKALQQFEAFKLNNIKLYQSTFEDFLESNVFNKSFDFVFVDGNHNKERTLFYFENLRKNASNDTLIIFDDIYWSKQMTEAWEEIIAHPDVTVSIDSFHWGLIFFRREQQKEHFIIRV